METDILVGIDVGSTNIRCCAYDSDARMLASAMRATLDHRRGGTRPTAEHLWELVCEVCRDTVRQLGDEALRHVQGLAVASVGCRALFLDARGRAFSLGDTGESTLYRRYVDQLGRENYAAITGYPPEPDSVAFQLSWLRENQPARWSDLDAILSVADYINLRLTGVRVRERSTAASMGLWDHREHGWWVEFLADITLPEGVLGPLADSGTFVGGVMPEVSSATGWLAGTPVFVGGHDYLCAALAVGCVRPGTQMNITGTFDIVASFHSQPPERPEIACHRSMMDHHVVPGLYGWMAEDLSGPQVEWFQREIAAEFKGSPPPLSELLREVETLPQPFTRTQEVFLPALFGEIFPGRFPRARGVCIGLTSSTTRPSLFRALIEGQCFQTRRMLEHVDGTQGPLPVVGGASQSPVWMQIKADVLGIPVCVPRIREATALGAALLAGVGATIYANCVEAADVVDAKGAEHYEPDPIRADVYDRVYRDVYLPLAEAVPRLGARLTEIASEAANYAGQAWAEAVERSSQM